MSNAAASDPEASASLTPEQLKWVSQFCGVQVEAAAEPGGSSASQSAGATLPAGDTAAPKGVLPATEGAVYFAQDKYVLTPEDQAELKRYADAYRKLSAADQVQVDGYASTEGTDKDNQKLSENWAQAVLKYLVEQGIPRENIKAVGHGETTAFSKDDLLQNRRVAIAPPMKAPNASSPGGDGPTSLKMRKGDEPPRIWLTDEDAKKIIDKNPPKPCTAPRADVEAALADYLTDVMKAQKMHTVTITLGVRTMAQILAKGLGEAGSKIESLLRDDRNSQDPKELAKKIAGLLPDVISAPISMSSRRRRPGKSPCRSRNRCSIT